MANNKKVLLRHLELLAVRCIAMVNNKISELTTAISEDLTELAESSEDTANKTTAITSESTDEQYPSAKAVYDLFSNNGNTNVIVKNSIVITDKTTGKKYDLYVADGKLMMEESTSTGDVVMEESEG